MANCLNCGEEIISLEGRRPKLYCDNKGKCKGEYFRKKKKQPKYVQKAVYDKLQEKYQNVLSKIDPNAGNVVEMQNKNRHIEGMGKFEKILSDMPPMPKKEDFSDSLEFAAAKNDWKLKYGNN